MIWIWFDLGVRDPLISDETGFPAHDRNQIIQKTSITDGIEFMWSWAVFHGLRLVSSEILLNRSFAEISPLVLESFCGSWGAESMMLTSAGFVWNPPKPIHRKTGQRISPSQNPDPQICWPTFYTMTLGRFQMKPVEVRVMKLRPWVPLMSKYFAMWVFWFEYGSEVMNHCQISVYCY